ncbi:unnamed protein product [Cylindrotheca closterium]|uniref:Fe2OG dioxygenase domain-containing protein n=1 Tax=Cylindrotheca closterium TaxID=2856 RepID=A0AAD2CJ01_9STRA|nr:unnamed protein product [Cylindrotheca closterium]
MLPTLNTMALKVLVLCLASIGLSHGFLGTQRHNQIVKRIANSNPLHAKAAKKKKKKTSDASSGGGFGRAPDMQKTKEVNAFSVFPALEEEVAGTLVPSVSELINEPGELPGEIYDRLDQIYGFPNFNSFTPKETTTSFADLISAPTANDNSKISNGDFASLLATATGETIPTSAGEGGGEDSTIDSISKIEPFAKMRVLHIDPLVIAVDNFFTDDECDRYIAISTAPSKNEKDSPFQTNSKTVGKDALAKAQRTSTTWFHHFKSVPELMAKASRLLGLKGISQWEEPQTVRYRRQEKFTWHLDALSPSEPASEIPGGQRIATLLVYLSELNKEDGGATIFRDLSADGTMLKVQPQKGSALLFFPAAGGIPNAPFDIRTLHCGEAVSQAAMQDKWISQLWLREGTYTPTAPAGNNHADATEPIIQYCTDGQI